MSEQAVLSTEQRRTLAAAVARVLPSEGGPGAAEAGVAEYLGQALGHRSYRTYLLPLMAQGLDFLDGLARQCHGEAFHRLDAPRQDELLGQLPGHAHPGVRMFFNLLVNLTLEGFLCDPVHGGNRDFVGWQALGYDAAALRTGLCQRRAAL